MKSKHSLPKNNKTQYDFTTNSGIKVLDMLLEKLEDDDIEFTNLPLEKEHCYFGYCISKENIKLVKEIAGDLDFNFNFNPFFLLSLISSTKVKIRYRDLPSDTKWPVELGTFEISHKDLTQLRLIMNEEMTRAYDNINQRFTEFTENESTSNQSKYPI